MLKLCSLALASAFLVFVSPAVFAQSGSSGVLSAVDYAFVGQTFQGNQFQVDTGRLGVDRAADPKVRAYAKEMVPSHVEVEQKLVAILQRKQVTQPPISLLASSYTAMVATLKDKSGAAFDREYVRQQMNYQTGNDSLYRWELANGTDPDLKAFATAVLVKIDEHFDLVKALAKANGGQ